MMPVDYQVADLQTTSRVSKQNIQRFILLMTKTVHHRPLRFQNATKYKQAEDNPKPVMHSKQYR